MTFCGCTYFFNTNNFNTPSVGSFSRFESNGKRATARVRIYEIGENRTGASVGGLEASDTHYLVARNHAVAQTRVAEIEGILEDLHLAFHFAMLVFLLAFMFRPNGYLPVPYVIMLIPFAALLVAWTADRAVVAIAGRVVAPVRRTAAAATRWLPSLAVRASP